MLSTKGEALALDVTTEVSKGRAANITSYSIQDGASRADGYTVGNPSISFSGVCTYSKIRPNDGDIKYLNPSELDKVINEMIESQQRFTLYGNDLIPTLDQVVITDYSINQSDKINAVEVSVTVEQVFVSETSKKSTFTESIKPSVKTNGAYSEETDNGDGKKTEQVNAEDSLGSSIWNFYKDLTIGVGDTIGITGGGG